jgi:hypothetical protein
VQQQQLQPQAHQQQRQLVDQDCFSRNTVAAAVAAVNQLMLGAPGSRSPLRAGSPLRGSFDNAMVSVDSVCSGALQA